jgi:hypothetical protein
MQIEELRRAVLGAPFKPFDLCLADGQRFHIPHPDFLFFMPGSNRTIVAAHGDGTGTNIDVMLVTEIDFRPKASGTKKRRKAG